MFLSYGVEFRSHVNSSTIPGMVSTRISPWGPSVAAVPREVGQLNEDGWEFTIQGNTARSAQGALDKLPNLATEGVT